MKTGFSSWSLVSVSVSAPAVAASASVKTARIRVSIALSKHSVHATGQLGLGNEARAPHWATSGPKSAASRLDVSTIVG